MRLLTSVTVYQYTSRYNSRNDAYFYKNIIYVFSLKKTNFLNASYLYDSA